MINLASAFLCVRFVLFFFIPPGWTCGAVQGEFFFFFRSCCDVLIIENFTLKALDIPEMMVQFKVWLQNCVFMCVDLHLQRAFWLDVSKAEAQLHSLCISWLCLWAGVLYEAVWCVSPSGWGIINYSCSLELPPPFLLPIICSPLSNLTLLPPPFSSPLVHQSLL